MKKLKLFLMVLAVMSLVYSVFAAEPVPDIRANGSDGPVVITPADPLSVTVSVDPGSYSGTASDWWVAAYTPWDWFSLGATGWLPGISPVYQGALFSLPSTTVLSLPGLPPGDYSFFIGIDMAMDGILSPAQFSYDSVLVTVASQGARLQREDFQYLGAFRLPGSDDRPRTFAYGGNAMTFNAAGDPQGAADGFPGSLFVMGHDRLPYGELPDGNQVAELSIPVPVISQDIQALNFAAFLQDFREVDGGLFEPLDEIPRAGMTLLSHPSTGPRIHLAWGAHFQEDPPVMIPSHAWFDLDLSKPATKGSWFIANRSLYSVNGYLFEIPASWAETNAQGRYLATGRYRDGGWSGQGPSLFAYVPWTDERGTPAQPGSAIANTALLLYENSRNSESVVDRSLKGYQHCDEWEGGAWITTSTGKIGVLFAGTKGTGEKYWYGWINPAGPAHPCVETAFIGEFPLCRMHDGSLCPAADLAGCSGHSDYRGWWSSSFAAQFLLYDQADLARVAAGSLQPWEPQPYASIGMDDRLFLNPSGVETEMLGSGVQRRYRIGDVAYDRANDLLYVLELFADEAKPVVHVWRVR